MLNYRWMILMQFVSSTGNTVSSWWELLILQVWMNKNAENEDYTQYFDLHANSYTFIHTHYTKTYRNLIDNSLTQSNNLCGGRTARASRMKLGIFSHRGFVIRTSRKSHWATTTDRNNYKNIYVSFCVVLVSSFFTSIILTQFKRSSPIYFKSFKLLFSSLLGKLTNVNWSAMRGNIKSSEVRQFVTESLFRL